LPDTSLSSAGEAAASPESKRVVAAIFLAAILIGLTGYLTVASMTGDGTPAGCGDASGAGCSEVLGTKWARVLGVPVSGLAVGLYVVVLATLVQRKRLGGVVLSVAATAIIGAAAWFMAVQLFFVQAICVYCTVDHALGVTLAVLLLVSTAKKHLLPGVIVGLLGTAGLVGLQLASDEAVFVVEGEGGTRAGQTLTLLDGRLTLNLDEEMIVGDVSQLANMESGRVLVKMSDYNCPHCRKAHHVLKDTLPDVAVVLLPMPLNPTCNPYQAELPREQFVHSCELARLAIAIHRIDPAQLAAYDAWAYGDGWPHTADQGRAFAETLVDPLRLQLELNDPAIDAAILRNVTAWGEARAANLVGGLPVHLAPGGGLTYGGVGDGTSLVQLLGGVHYSQQETTPDPP